METVTRMYISRIGIGDHEKCVRMGLGEVMAALQILVDKREISDALVQVFNSEDEIRAERLPVQPVVNATEGRFPVVWVAVGQTPPRPSPGLEEVERTYQLELIDTFSPNP